MGHPAERTQKWGAYSSPYEAECDTDCTDPKNRGHDGETPRQHNETSRSGLQVKRQDTERWGTERRETERRQTERRETETRRRETETRRRETETRRREPETGRRETETGRSETETGGRETETGRRETETGRSETETGRRGSLWRRSNLQYNLEHTDPPRRFAAQVVQTKHVVIETARAALAPRDVEMSHAETVEGRGETVEGRGETVQGDGRQGGEGKILIGGQDVWMLITGVMTTSFVVATALTFSIMTLLLILPFLVLHWFLDMICIPIQTKPLIRLLSRSREYLPAVVNDFFLFVCFAVCQFVLPVYYLGSVICVSPRMVRRQAWLKYAESNAVEINGLRWVALERNRHGQIKVPEGCMFVCNHLSQLDGFFAKSFFFPLSLRPLMKADVTKVPILGWIPRLCREPLVRFNSQKRGWGVDQKEELFARCKELTDLGYPLLVFPEGVRRQFGRIAPLRHGMLRFAIENRLPIYPLIVYGTQNAWPLTSVLCKPAPIYAHISEAVIQPEGDETPALLEKEITRQWMKLLAACPGFDSVRERPIEDLQTYKLIEAAHQDFRPPS